MVRNYKRKTKSIDKKQLEKAMKAVRDGSSIRAAAKDYGLNYETLRAHIGVSNTAPLQKVNKEKLSNALASIKHGSKISHTAKEFGLNYETLRSHVSRSDMIPYHQVSFVFVNLFPFQSQCTDSCVIEIRFSVQIKRRL